MQINPNILKTKLRFSGVPNCVPRERLQPVFQKILRRKLTLVIAGAGYGKSTLVFQAVTQLGQACLWYRLDAYDQDFNTFIGYLIAGLSNQFPELGEVITKEINEALGLGRRPEEVLTILLRHLENLPCNDFLIVLDDYHLVQKSGIINRSLEFILKNLPPQIHLILTSRSDPKLAISQLKAARAVLELDENDLRFSIAETAALYGNIFELSLDETTLRDLKHKTGGWAAALILFFHGLKGKSHDAIEDALKRITGSHKIIAGYLEENVYALLPEETKHFLLKTSLLTRMNVTFCDRLLGCACSSLILADLEQEHLFTFPLDEERQWFCYHHLFQDFLQKKLHAEYHRNRIRELHSEIARLWLEEGEKEEALGHYLAGEHLEQACWLLSESAAQFIFRGRLSNIQGYIQNTSRQHRVNEPWILFLQGLAATLSGKGSDAVLFIQRACFAFEQKGLSNGAILCWQFLGYIHFMDGDFKKALDIFTRLIQNENVLPSEHPGSYIHLIQLACHMGRMDLADQYAWTFASIINDVEDPGLRTLAQTYFDISVSWRYILASRPVQARFYLDRAFEPLARNDFRTLVSFHHNLTSILHALHGNHEKGLASARQGLALMRASGIQDFFPFGWLLIPEASNLFELGQIQEAIEKANACINFFQKAGFRWGIGLGHLLLYKINLHTGDIQSAQMHFESCHAILAGLTIPLLQGELKIISAVTALTEKKFLEAEILIASAAQELIPFPNHHALLLLASVRLYQAWGKKHQALQTLKGVLDICRDYQFDLTNIFSRKVNHPILGDPAWIIPLLMEVSDNADQPGDIQPLIHGLERLSASIPQKAQVGDCHLAQKNSMEIKRSPRAMTTPGLHVFCLGTFKLFLGEREIPAERWKSKNALNLFKYFVAKQSRGYLHREILSEMLWPEQEPLKTANRLRVTISALRRVLEPELTKGMVSSYILNHNHFYRLDLGSGGSVDTVRFEEALKHAEESRNDPPAVLGHYLKAEALYQGDFLAEDLYLDWCLPLREYYREKYLNLMTRFMEYFEQERSYDRAIEYGNKYLAVDPYEEEIYQALMRYYSLLGDRVMIGRTFARCKEQLTTALDCPLSQTTEALFKSLRHSA